MSEWGESIQIKPTLGASGASGTAGGAGGSLGGERPLLPIPAWKEPPVFGGLFFRFMAFAADVILLLILDIVLENAARAFLVKLNPALPWLGFAASFAYFWLANGPVGRGRTVGKLIFHLRVVDARGQTLGWGASFKRALLQQAALWALIAPEEMAVGMPRHFIYPLLLLLGYTGKALTLALMLALAMDDRRRSWHDVIAGSYVSRGPCGEAFKSAVNAPVDPAVRASNTFNFRLQILVALIGSIALPLMRRGAWQPMAEIYRDADALQIAAPLPPFRLTQAVWPEQAQATAFREWIGTRMDQAAAETSASLGSGKPLEGEPITTDTLTAMIRRWGAPDGETIIIGGELPHGSITREQISTPAFKEEVRRLIGIAAKEAKQRHAADGTKYNAPQRVAMLMVEPFSLLVEPLPLWVYNRAMARVRVLASLDAQGEAAADLAIDFVITDRKTGELVPDTGDTNKENLRPTKNADTTETTSTQTKH